MKTTPLTRRAINREIETVNYFKDCSVGDESDSKKLTTVRALLNRLGLPNYLVLGD